MELRCKKLHGVIADEIIEIKCNSRYCGAQPGVVVLHRFNLHTGELVETKQFKDPATQERSTNVTGNEHAAVRTP